MKLIVLMFMFMFMFMIMFRFTYSVYEQCTCTCSSYERNAELANYYSILFALPCFTWLSFASLFSLRLALFPFTFATENSCSALEQNKPKKTSDSLPSVENFAFVLHTFWFNRK
jgi:hypothetical protein